MAVIKFQDPNSKIQKRNTKSQIPRDRSNDKGPEIWDLVFIIWGLWIEIWDFFGSCDLKFVILN